MVGHSLENDLLALQISHSLVMDTAVLYKQSRGGTYKISLRVLTRKYLSREIQNSGNGHDSIEDAKAAMDLGFLKIKHGNSLNFLFALFYLWPFFIQLFSKYLSSSDLLPKDFIIYRS